VDLSQNISCKNDSNNSYWTDYVKLTKGTTFNGALSAFTGTIYFSGNNYPIPYQSTSTQGIKLTSQSKINIPIKLSLSPVSSAAPVNGLLIKAGTLIASITMNQTNNHGFLTDIFQFDSTNFTWNVYAKNDVVIPQAACNVDSSNNTAAVPINIGVELPNYPGSKDIPLMIRCTSNQNLGFYISGQTSSDNSTFVNTLESDSNRSSAHGVGIQVVRNGVAIPINTNQNLGTVDTSGKSLGLSARYNKIGTQQITAGNVRSIVQLTFTYN